ncbi:hypothetical protein V5O48_013060 [Marasmius crinis-equi]|uniref:Acetyltransferase n=1 Tax=Marasmius crinis-equi TaxID=585013 RepID=A0ABR3F132_9AGAR
MGSISPHPLDFLIPEPAFSKAKTSKDEKMLAMARGLNGFPEAGPEAEEFEKMVCGMHHGFDRSIIRTKHRTRCLVHKFNNLDPATDGMTMGSSTPGKLIEEMLGRVGKGVFIEAPFRVDYGCNTIVGDGCFFNFGLTILDSSLVTIGNHVAIGPNVTIISVNHYTSPLSRLNMYGYAQPVTIEDNVWIGGCATILPGVTIGKGSTVGAGSVVTRDVPPFSVVVGCPARVIKKVQSVEEERADPGNPFREASFVFPEDGKIFE